MFLAVLFFCRLCKIYKFQITRNNTAINDNIRTEHALKLDNSQFWLLYFIININFCVCHYKNAPRTSILRRTKPFSVLVVVLVCSYLTLILVTTHEKRVMIAQCAKQDEMKTEHHDAVRNQNQKNKQNKKYNFGENTTGHRELAKLGIQNVRELNAGRDSAKSCVIIKCTHNPRISNRTNNNISKRRKNTHCVSEYLYGAELRISGV